MSTGNSFPLASASKAQLYLLGKTLWSWELCEGCERRKSCMTTTCATTRVARLARYVDYYKEITGAYEPELKQGEEPALKNHEGLLSIVATLKSNAALTRAELRRRSFSSRVPVTDQESAINLAVTVLVMVNCASQHQNQNFLEYGLSRVTWKDDIPFSSFLEDAFPISDHPGINDSDKTLDIKTALKAIKLKKHSKLEFRPTNDLGCHLALDLKTGTVSIFHHTAFLKEYLKLTKDESRDPNTGESSRLGALPRQLALEVLDSIQKVLFPLSDPKSRSLLSSLVSTSSFDPDCLRFESASIRLPSEKDIPYLYFGSRLADLYEELENPTPRGFEKWFERKSGARYVMMATLFGVLFAVLLGIASLGVSSYQAWIGYQQWQHPVTPGGG